MSFAAPVMQQLSDLDKCKLKYDRKMGNFSSTELKHRARDYGRFNPVRKITNYSKLPRDMLCNELNSRGVQLSFQGRKKRSHRKSHSKRRMMKHSKGRKSSSRRRHSKSRSHHRK